MVLPLIFVGFYMYQFFRFVFGFGFQLCTLPFFIQMCVLIRFAVVVCFAYHTDCLLCPVTLTLESDFLLLIKSRANKVCVSFCTSTIVLWLKLLSYILLSSERRQTVDKGYMRTLAKNFL